MQPPTHALATILFGAQAGMILDELPERLRRWDAAFDDWLGETHQRSPLLMVQRHSAWRNFLKFTLKPPWEIKPADVQAWVDHLQDERGCTPGSVSVFLNLLHNYYRFAIERGVEAGLLDPVAAVSRPFNPSPLPAYTLNETELAAFLAAIEPQTSALGKRNYAMILLILSCGLSPREVRWLRYGDLSGDWSTATIVLQRIHLVKPLAVDLPTEVVLAIHDYLQAAGRLPDIQAGQVLFARPSPTYSKNGPHTSASWLIETPIDHTYFTKIVYSIARRAHLDDRRITPLVIRYTAVSRRIQLGDDTPTLQRFIGVRHLCKVYELKKRITDQPPGAMPKQDPASHKLYAAAIPAADLKLLEQANPVGLQDEIDALRLTLMNTLRQANGANPGEQIRLLDSYSAAAARLASLLKTQKELDQTGDDFDARLEHALRQVQQDKGWDLGLG